MAIKKFADKLVNDLENIHGAIGDMIREYLDEYADYGWDNICTELATINANIDMVMTELKYAETKEQLAKTAYERRMEEAMEMTI